MVALPFKLVFFMPWAINRVIAAAFHADTSEVARAKNFERLLELNTIRALPDSPSGGYAPANVKCPDVRPTIRDANDISPEEKSWLQLRRNQVTEPMISWLSRTGIPNFDTTSYMNKIKQNVTAMPNIGIAVSGGGYRALMNGGGFLAAADERVTNSSGPGQIGGLLQATTYLAGLSGGGWLVGSMYVNNFSSVEELRDGSYGSGVWQFSHTILESPKANGFRLFNDAQYIRSVANTVDTKAAAGFNTSITDYWGRALSFQLINATDGGPAYSFSSIAEQEDFKNGSIPFPFLVADNGDPNAKKALKSVDSNVYEISPLELGSWDSSIGGFVPTKYIGSNFSDGSIPPDGKCVNGFDQAGFIMGTTSSLFNQAFVAIDDSTPQILKTFLKSVSDKNDDVAQYQPNPFFGFKKDTNRISKSIEMSLADGGIDGQNIPLYPLLQPQRNVDIIFAVDSSADTTFNWPNGTALIATYERSLNSSVQNGISFPSVPDQNTFVNLGLNTRPTFFGCDASNTTGDAPLVVYMPNAPYTVQSNASTFNLSYTDMQRNLIIENGFNGATQGNSSLDSEWPACMGCAILSRSFTKTRTPVPDSCQNCFKRYCWDGSLNSTSPAEYNPLNKITQKK